MQPSTISDTFKSLLGILIYFILTPFLNETMDEAGYSILRQNKSSHPTPSDQGFPKVAGFVKASA
jgi:hypothetical protein